VRKLSASKSKAKDCAVGNFLSLDCLRGDSL